MGDDTLKSSLLRLPPLSKFVAKKSIKKHKMYRENATIEDLNKFVEECMSKGYHESRVRTALISVGWTKEQVDGAFRKIGK